MLFCAHRISLLILLVLAYPYLAIGDNPVIVYKNSTQPTRSETSAGNIPAGFLPFNYFIGTGAEGENTEPRPMGDEIILEGSQHHITRFDLFLASNGTVELESLTLTLHDEHEYSDHQPAFPVVGSPLWSGTLYNIVVNETQTVTFSVPAVEVPEMFVWTVETNNFSQKVGLATYNPATIGINPLNPYHFPEPEDYYYVYDPEYPYGWGTPSFGSNPEANFGAIVWAVPEPTVTGALFAGGMRILWRRKR